MDLFLQPSGGPRVALPIPTTSERHRLTPSPRAWAAHLCELWQGEGGRWRGGIKIQVLNCSRPGSLHRLILRGEWLQRLRIVRANKCFSSALDWETKLSAEEAANPTPILPLHVYPQELPRTRAAPYCHGLFLDSASYTLNIATSPKESDNKEASGNNFWLGLRKISCCLSVTSEENGFLLCFTTQCLQQGCYSCRLSCTLAGGSFPGFTQDLWPLPSQLLTAASPHSCPLPKSGLPQDNIYCP